MVIKASDLGGLQRAIDKALAKEQGKMPDLPTTLWLARTSTLAIKPIRSRDPVIFMAMIKKLQEMYPKLNIYIFEIEGV